MPGVSAAAVPIGLASGTNAWLGAAIKENIIGATI
jgi:hypothetical protein